MLRKRKRMTPEEWAHLEARMARLEARERQLRELVEIREAEKARPALDGPPDGVIPGAAPGPHVR